MDDALKRFTDTGKWEDKWFRSLSPTAKLLWSWLLDHCDNAGVIDPDIMLATFQIGDTVKEDHFTELGDRIQTLPNGKRWIPKFIRFQFGQLSPESRVHASVVKLLRFHNIQYPMDSLSIPYVKGIDTLKDKDKDKDKEGVQGEIDAFPEILNTPEFKEAWKRWHEHLKQKRKPATIHARDLQLHTLSKMGVIRAIAALNNSIERNWQGIYESTNSGNGKPSNKPNPRNFGTIVGPTNYGTAKPRLQRELEEKKRLAEQMVASQNNPPPA
jgi:hypothetical protein